MKDSEHEFRVTGIKKIIFASKKAFRVHQKVVLLRKMALFFLSIIATFALCGEKAEFLMLKGKVIPLQAWTGP